MTQKDRMKLLEAGFTVIRKSETVTYPDGYGNEPVYKDICIKGVTPTQHNWVTLEKGFASRTARDKHMAELLRDRKIIEE